MKPIKSFSGVSGSRWLLLIFTVIAGVSFSLWWIFLGKNLWTSHDEANKLKAFSTQKEIPSGRSHPERIKPPGGVLKDGKNSSKIPSDTAASARRRELQRLSEAAISLLDAFPPSPTDVSAEAARTLRRSALDWEAGLNDGSPGGRELVEWLGGDPRNREPVAAQAAAHFWKTETAELLANSSTRNAMLRYLKAVLSDVETRMQPLNGWNGDTESYYEATFGNERLAKPPLSGWIEILRSVQSGQVSPDAPPPMAGGDSAGGGFTSEMAEYIRDEIRATITEHFHEANK